MAPYSTKLPGSTRSSRFSRAVRWLVLRRRATASGRLPSSVIERARLVLAKLEQEDRAAPKGFEDLPLFATPYKAPQGVQDAAHELLVGAVAALNPDEMSPREAMEAIYTLKAKLREAE